MFQNSRKSLQSLPFDPLHDEALFDMGRPKLTLQKKLCNLIWNETRCSVRLRLHEDMGVLYCLNRWYWVLSLNVTPSSFWSLIRVNIACRVDRKFFMHASVYAHAASISWSSRKRGFCSFVTSKNGPTKTQSCIRWYPFPEDKFPKVSDIHILAQNYVAAQGGIGPFPILSKFPV